MKICSALLVVPSLLLVLGVVACNDVSTGTLLIGGGGGGDDDDSLSGDDDDTAGGDDDTVGGDDDTAGGDDDTAGGDDDTAGGDDDTAGDDDDDTFGDHVLAGDYEGQFLMFIDMPGSGDELEEACEGWIGLEVEGDGDYSAEAECESLVWGTPDYEFELEGTVTTSLQFTGVVNGSNSWSGQVAESPSLGYIKDDFIKIEWDGVTPGQGQMARPYSGVAWMELD